MGATNADLRFLWVTFAAWAIPVALSVVASDSPAIPATALAVGLLSGAAILFRPGTALVALPFLALLSPLGGFVPLPGARLLLSDLIFPLLAVQCAILVVHGRIRLGRGITLPSILGVCYLLSMMAGLAMGTLVSVKPILYVLQFAIVYLYTREYARDEQGWAVVITAWIAATTLGAVLLINAFLSGVMLAGFEYGADAPASADTLLTLFRATYYYAGFHFLLGISLVILLLALLFRAPARQRLAIVPAFAILSAAILMMLAKTAIAAVFVTVLVVLGLLMPHRPRETMRAVAILAIWLGVIVVGVSATFFALLGDAQSELWTNRVFSSGSFIARVEVYQTAIASWMSRPIAVITGLGPDFLGDSGAPGFALSFMRSAATGVQEGAVDSGWMTYLLEFGIMGFALLVATFLTSVKRLRRHVHQLPGAAGLGPTVFALAGLIFLAIALLTQMLGYSKTAWFPFQLLIIGLMHAQVARPEPSVDPTDKLEGSD